MANSSLLEDEFFSKWIAAHPNIVPTRQYKWHPKRRYVSDFAFLEYFVLVEIQGTFSRVSRHTTPQGYHNDCVRMCEAQILGWKMLYIDTLFSKNWGDAITIVERALGINKRIIL